MKVYACPKEIPAPEIDFKNFDLKKMQADEAAHMAKLKAYLIKMGYSGEHTGKELAIPHADGHARYMFADVPKGSKRGTVSVLIHLPYGDAWESPHASYMPKTEALRQIEQRARLAEMFAKKRRRLMLSKMKVHVHAWEYVNGDDAGGGGFDWWYDAENARASYARGAHARIGGDAADVADFLFIAEVSDDHRGDEVTDEIDGELHELCALARTRKVGAHVLAYWQAHGFHMGDADNPASDDDDGEGVGHVAPEH
jgi:hypothetical protein